MIQAIDEVDYKIIAELQKNARVKNRDIARKLNVSQSTVSKRVRKLEGTGIIKRYTCVLNYRALGFTTVAFSFIRCKDQSANNVEKLVDRLKENREVIEFHKVLGEDDIILKVYARNTQDFQRIIEKLTQSDNIEHIRSALVTETLVESSGPALS